MVVMISMEKYRKIRLGWKVESRLRSCREEIKGYSNEGKIRSILRYQLVIARK